MADPILPNLVFTRSTGRHHGERDTRFNDAIDLGGFPAGLKIEAIEWITVYASGTRPDAYINGLTIKYKGITNAVDHGIVNGTQVGRVAIDDDHLLVGVFGRLKQGDTNEDLINSIGFVLFDKSLGIVVNEGPFQGTTERQTSPWASFGLILAFQGTKLDRVGLTSLGFVKSNGPFQDIQIIQHPAVRNFADIL